MPLYTSTTTNNQQQTPGTLNSEGLYFQPNVPRQSQATGIQGTDGRAYTGNVQSNELVENRLTNLLQKKNPYIQNAQQRGLQAAGKRGLLNSSIAAGSAERAAIEAGMPIASADAQTFLQTRMQNQGDLNQNLMQERDIANRMLQGSREQGTQLALQEGQLADNERDRLNRMLLQRENLAFSGEQQGLDRQQQEMMSRLGYNQDLGRLGVGFQYDIGRAREGARLEDNLADNAAFRTDWLQDNQFNRDFYGNLALNFQQAQIRDSSTFYSQLTGALFENPEVFGNPEYLSGLNNFFSNEIFDNRFDSFMSQFYGG